MTGETQATEDKDVSHEDLFNEMYGADSPDSDSNEDLLEAEPAAAPAEELDEVEESEPVKAEGKPVVDPEVKKEDKTPVADDPYAWISTLPEEYKSSADRLRHEALSDRGRVSALSRKLNEMQSALAAVTARTKTDPEVTAPAKPVAQEPPEAFRQLKEDYPELGKQLDEIFSYERTQAEKLIDSRLQPIQEKLSTDAVASETARLEQEAAKIFNTEKTGVHWKDVVASDDFAAWVDQQPSFIQNAARSTQSASEGIEILRMFEDAYQVAIKSTQAEETPAAKEPAEDTSRADQLKAQRQARRDATVSPQSLPAGTDTDSMSGDHESMFNAMWSKKPSRR